MTFISLPGKNSQNPRRDFGMTLPPRPVSIKQLPEKLNLRRGRLFFRELETCINVERPCLVLECSRIREMDKYAVHLLLCCLEGAIKRNGDVRLAAVAPDAMLNLESAGLDRLFRIFETVDEAVESFERRGVHLAPHSINSDARQSSAVRLEGVRLELRN
jgi:anti-anti-sigma regulatory factor